MKEFLFIVCKDYEANGQELREILVLLQEVATYDQYRIV